MLFSMWFNHSRIGIRKGLAQGFGVRGIGEGARLNGIPAGASLRTG